MKPMMNDDGLLECAHCGEIDEVITGERLVGDHVYQHVMCMKCGIETGAIDGMHRAVKIWNTRNGHLYTADDYKQDALERKHGL
jgi:hypothetical protein